jgi:hypothetical protein
MMSSIVGRVAMLSASNRCKYAQNNKIEDTRSHKEELVPRRVFIDIVPFESCEPLGVINL